MVWWPSKVRRGVALAASALALLAMHGVASAHDDPIVTVRVMCNGFNVLDIDAVLGEISDTANLSVDRPVHGVSEIEAWVKEQMDHDLRIEIMDIGSPQRLPDGYTLTWTARFSRADWRQAGIGSREVTNAITIHNGRITDWNASFASPGGEAPQTQPSSPAIDQPSVNSGIPELLGVPVTLLLVILVLTLAGVWMSRRWMRRA